MKVWAVLHTFLQTILMNDCIIRGDLANIRMGKYCIVGERTIVRPAYKKFSKGLVLERIDR